MMLVLLAAGAALSALGTRLAAAAFVGAAVLAARDPTVALVGTWTAALAAVLVLASPSLRRVAVPAAGAAAVLAAAASPNGAVVMGLWVLGSSAAVWTVVRSGVGRRWAGSLCLLDLVLAAAIASTAAGGFQGWPATIGSPAAVALLGASVLRAALAGGPEDEGGPAGMLVVRTQALVCGSFAVAAGSADVGQAAALAGAAVWALGPALGGRARTDSIQEAGLYLVALGSALAGWGPPGWAWGALAAGTLTHQLRLSFGPKAPGRAAQLLRSSAGIGLPFFPVVLAILDAAVGRRGVVAVVVTLALLVGLAGRARMPVSPRRRSPASPAVAWGTLSLVVTVALWGRVLAMPSPPAGRAISVSVAAAAAVGVAAVLGAWARSAVAGRRRAVGQAALPAPVEAALARVVPGEERMGPTLVWALLAAVAAAAAVLWSVGLSRGFL